MACCFLGLKGVWGLGLGCEEARVLGGGEETGVLSRLKDVNPTLVKRLCSRLFLAGKLELSLCLCVFSYAWAVWEYVWQ